MSIKDLHELFMKSSGVITDSRKVKNNCIFFSLKGEKFNGNEFANSAVKKGAMLAVVDEKKFSQNKENYILVENCLETLQNLANFHRKKLNTKIIGITGSNGKTTTTLLLGHVLRNAGYDVLVAGNIGIGFALSVSERDYEYIVLELSSFQLDGIKSFRSDIAIVLNVSPDHMHRYNYNFESYIKSKFRITKNQNPNEPQLNRASKYVQRNNT